VRVYIIAFLVSLFVGILGYWGAAFLWGSRSNSSDTLDRLALISSWEQEGVPDFQIADVTLKSRPEPIKIVHFWASWCGPCVEEIPSLQELAKKLGNQVLIIALSQDSTEQDMLGFLKEHKINSSSNLQFVFDKKPRISSLYKVEKLPESYIVDQRLKLKKRISGSIEWVTPESRAYFDNLLSGASQ